MQQKMVLTHSILTLAGGGSIGQMGFWQCGAASNELFYEEGKAKVP